jgi:hypothetical protein
LSFELTFVVEECSARRLPVDRCIMIATCDALQGGWAIQHWRTITVFDDSEVRGGEKKFVVHLCLMADCLAAALDALGRNTSSAGGEARLPAHPYLSWPPLGR